MATDRNTLVFSLKASCKHNPEALPDAIYPNDKYIGSSVYTSSMVWVPQGDQETRLNPIPSVVHNDILLAKLRPPQAIELEMHAIKGIGRDHAKFSPVSTASYRLLPSIEILKPIEGADADRFRNCFPKGVIEVVGEGKSKKAKVVNPRKDTVSRECLRHAEFEGKVRLGRVRNHFLCKFIQTFSLLFSSLFFPFSFYFYE